MGYPGGKSGAGVVQKIINQIPPHSLYITAFAGHDAPLRSMRRAAAAIAIDSDVHVIEYWQELALPGVTAIKGDAISFLKSYNWQGGEFVYCDPPYLKFDVDGSPVRKSARDIYDNEFDTVPQHEGLLRVLLGLPCMVAISGYWSSLYASMLQGWRYISYNTIARDGTVRREYLWMNYPEPVELHDYRYLGDNFREREKITRQKKRWRARLLRMDRLQRYALLSSIAELNDASASS